MNGFGTQVGMLGAVVLAPALFDEGHYANYEWDSYVPTLAGQVFNILDYGADPLGYLDSTLAISLANTAAWAWQDANEGGQVTLYAPAGDYKVIPSGTSDNPGYVLYLHRSNFAFEGDGPTLTRFRCLAQGGRDPNSDTVYKRGGLFTTLFASTSEEEPLVNITVKGIRACGMADVTELAGVWEGGGSYRGWDDTHKGFAVFNIWCDNIKILDCEWDHWRGEALYSGGSYELGAFEVTRCVVRRCNSSALSMGGDVTLTFSKFYDCYNGTECFMYGPGQHFQVEDCTFGPATEGGLTGSFGLVFLGVPTASFTCLRCTFEGMDQSGIFLSEGASNVTIDEVTATNTTPIYWAYQDLYDPEDFPYEYCDLWVNWNITNITARITDAGDLTEYVFSSPASPGHDWTIDGITVENHEGHSFTAVMSTKGATGTYILTNVDADGSDLIAANVGNRPLGTENTTPTTGYYGLGQRITDTAPADATPLQVEPAWGRTNVVFINNSVSYRIVEPTTAVMAKFPDGFIWTIHRGGENPHLRSVRIQPDDWNTLSETYDIFENDELTLIFDEGTGKFDLVEWLPA